MIISVTSPRNGLGQSITTINLSAALSMLLQSKAYNGHKEIKDTRDKKTLIIDSNYKSNDIEYFLSDGRLTKGIDDFVSLHKCNLLSVDRFSSCVKSIHKNIDIMASNLNQEFTPQYADILIDYINKLYNVTIIDTMSLTDNLSKAFFKLSDYIIIVLSQTKQSVKQFIQKYKPLKSVGKKLIIIVNKYINKLDGLSAEYNLALIKKELILSGYQCPVFVLPFNMELANECNAHTVLNLVLNTQNRNNEYVKDIKNIGGYLLSDGKALNTEVKGNHVRFNIFKGLTAIK